MALRAFQEPEALFQRAGPEDNRTEIISPANEQYKGRGAACSKSPSGGPRPKDGPRAKGGTEALVSNKKGRLNASDDLFLYSNEGLLIRMKDLFE